MSCGGNAADSLRGLPAISVSLLPETDPAIVEAAARLVPRARVTRDVDVPEAEPEPDEAEESGVGSMLDDAEESGEISEPVTHPLTQTARTMSPRPNGTPP